MKTIKSSSDLANFLKQFRQAAKLKPIDFAQKLGITKNEVILLERGQDVGIHAVFSALNALGLQLIVVEELPANVKVVENFDEYYQKRFRRKLENNAQLEPEKQGFLKPTDRKRMSIVNLKKAFEI